MVRWFGYMRGTYHGPYPTRAESFEAIESSTGTLTPESPLSRYSEMGIPLERAQELARVVSRYFAHPEWRSLPLRWAIYRDATVVIGIPERLVILVDRGTGEKYANYAHRGR